MRFDTLLPMLLPFLMVVGVVVLLFAVSKPSPHVASPSRWGRWEIRAARILLGAVALFALLMGAGEIVQGYVTGADLLTAAVFAFFAWIAGRRPGVASIVLTVLGVCAGTFLVLTRQGGSAARIPTILFGAILPFVIPGLLLLFASRQQIPSVNQEQRVGQPCEHKVTKGEDREGRWRAF